MINLDIEKIVIQKLIFDENYITEISAKYFKIPIAKHLYKYLKSTLGKKEVLNTSTLAMDAANEKHSILDIFNYSMVGGSENIESPRFYINFLKEKHFKEIFTVKIMDAMQKLSEPNGDIYSIFAKFDEVKKEIEQEIKESNITLQNGLNDAMQELYQRVDDFRQDRQGYKLGFKEIDDLVTLKGGDMLILGSRPSQGKTSLANNFAMNLARNDNSILYISLEVTATSLSSRFLLSENSSVDFNKFKHGSLSDNELTEIEKSLSKFDEMNLRIISGQGSIDQVLKNITIDKQRFNTDVVILDYIQLIRSTEGGNDNEKLTYISAMLKDIALRLNIPIIVLAQLNRDIETRTEKRHRTSDIRGSGAIEQDADIMCFIYNSFIQDKKEKIEGFEDTPETRHLELQFQKNRNGQIGDVKLYFNETISKFYDSVNDSIEGDSLPF